MKKHFEIIDYKLLIIWELKTINDASMLSGTLYWDMMNMEDYAYFETPLTSLNEIDDQKEYGRELLLRVHKHQPITTK